MLKLWLPEPPEIKFLKVFSKINHMHLRLYALFALLTFILLGTGYLLGGFGGVIIALVFAFFLNFFSYWYSDKIVLSIYHAKPMRKEDYPEIYESVKALAEKANIPTPRLYIVEMDVPNAFATGRDAKHAAVAVTRGLINCLSVEEVEGVLAHEISHIKHRDTLVQTAAAVIGAAISWLGYVFMFGNRENRSALGFIVFMILAPIAATLIRLAISRSREFYADHEAGLLINPLHLASALEKISSFVSYHRVEGNNATAHLFIINPFSSGDLVKLFSTHPPTEERITRLRKMALS